MRRYETTFIVNPQADDAAIDRQVTAVIDLIKADGGQVMEDNRIGTRRLAYPIEGLVQGYYTSLIFDAETTALPKLDRHYKLEEPYIRSMVIRYEGPLATEKKAAEEAAAAKEAEIAEAKAEARAEAKAAEEEKAKAETKTDAPADEEKKEAEPEKSDEPATDQPDNPGDEL